MKRHAVIFACALLAAPLATPVFGQSVGEKTGVDLALGLSPSTADFVKEAAIGDLFEIQSSKLAETKGNRAERAFAAHMISDHTKSSNQLVGLVGSGKVTEKIPTALDSSHQSDLDKLNAAKGDDFSSKFDAMQVTAHKDAVSLFERYANSGDNADLKAWANKTLPALQDHLNMAENLDKSRTDRVVGQSH